MATEYPDPDYCACGSTVRRIDTDMSLRVYFPAKAITAHPDEACHWTPFRTTVARHSAEPVTPPTRRDYARLTRE